MRKIIYFFICIIVLSQAIGCTQIKLHQIEQSIEKAYSDKEYTNLNELCDEYIALAGIDNTIEHYNEVGKLYNKYCELSDEADSLNENGEFYYNGKKLDFNSRRIIYDMDMYEIASRLEELTDDDYFKEQSERHFLSALYLYVLKLAGDSEKIRLFFLDISNAYENSNLFDTSLTDEIFFLFSTSNADDELKNLDYFSITSKLQNGPNKYSNLISEVIRTKEDLIDTANQITSFYYIDEEFFYSQYELTFSSYKNLYDKIKSIMDRLPSVPAWMD